MTGVSGPDERLRGPARAAGAAGHGAEASDRGGASADGMGRR